MGKCVSQLILIISLKTRTWIPFLKIKMASLERKIICTNFYEEITNDFSFEFKINKQNFFFLNHENFNKNELFPKKILHKFRAYFKLKKIFQMFFFQKPA